MTLNTMTEISPIEAVVMRRVRRMRILLLILSTVTLATLTALAALWGIGREVWVARVFENMPHAGGLSALASFWFAAFLNTHLIVQLLVILTLISLLLLARETVRMLVTRITPPRASL